MPETRNKRFLEFVRKAPGFGFEDELKELVERHGSDTPALLQAIIDAKLLEQGGGLPAMGATPSVSPTSIRLPRSSPRRRWRSCRWRSPRKRISIGLYVIEGILTVAMATPEDEALVRRLGQIAQMPVSPVFASAREIRTRSPSIIRTTRTSRRASARWSASTSSTGRTTPASSSPPWRRPPRSIQVLDAIIYYRHPRAGDRHSHRAAGTPVAHPLPHRRHAARDA